MKSIYKRGKEPDTIQMERVLTLRHGAGIGGMLLKEGIKNVRKRQNPKQIFIEVMIVI